jgi:hypothetical protein
LSRRQRDTLFERKKHVKSAQFFRIADGGKSFEMKNRLAAMILAEPASFYSVPARLGITAGEKNLAELREALRKVREELGGDFALIAAGAKDSGDNDPAWSFAAQWLWNFVSVNLQESRA